MPDTSILLDLCQLLKINVNELLSGGITFLIGFTTLSVAAENLTAFLPNLAVASLSLLYSFILALFLLPVKKRLETVLNEGDII